MTDRQILIVEDELLVAEDVRRKLARIGYDVPAAALTGREAVARAGELRPDLVLMDIELPGEMDGVEAADEIRRRFDIPVVYLTAHSDSDTLARAKITGPFGYVLKPFVIRDLRTTIEMALYKHEQEKKLRESEARYRALFEQNLAGVYRSTLDGRLIECNESFAHILGYDSPQRICEQSTWDFYFDSAERERFVERLREQGMLVNQEFRLRRQDGSPVWVLENSNLLESGVIQGTLVDVTERVRAQEALQRSLDEMHRTNHMLLALNQAAQTVQRARTPDEVYHTIGEQVRKLEYNAVIYILTEDQAHLELAYLTYDSALIETAESLLGLPAERHRFPLKPGGFYQRLFASREATFTARIESRISEVLPQDLHASAPRIAELFRLREAILAPLIVGETAQGVLVVGGAGLTEADLPAVEAFAHQASIALENARLFEQVHAARERLANLSRRLIDAQETERRRLARELHDEIGQALTVLKINLQTAQRLAASDEIDTYLENSIRTVSATLEQVRSLSLDLRPSLLDDLGLVPALRWHLDRQGQSGHLATHFAFDPVDERLSPEIEITCFRIVQEALTNALRHAQAQAVHVELRRGARDLFMTIRDDGVGFDVTAAREGAARGESTGLLGMEERVQLLGGRIEIDSAPGEGTEIRVRFPLAHPAATDPQDRGILP